MDRQSTDSPVEVGVVVKPHGLRGAVKVHLHDKSSSSLQRVKDVLLVLPEEQLRVRIQLLGTMSEFLLLAIDGVTDREEAERLRGARVLVERSVMEPLEEGQYLYADLVGCRVVGEGGRALGVVQEVFTAGASDVLVVRDGELETMIPLVDDWVETIDLNARTIQVVGSEQWERWER
jgi:16S rRNA processing protein RimM